MDFKDSLNVYSLEDSGNDRDGNGLASKDCDFVDSLASVQVDGNSTSTYKSNSKNNEDSTPPWEALSITFGGFHHGQTDLEVALGLTDGEALEDVLAVVESEGLGTDLVDSLKETDVEVFLFIFAIV